MALRADSVDAALGVLESSRAVTSLDCCCNGFQDVDVERIAAGLRRNTKVTTLYLGDNSIRAHGAGRLAAALEGNCTLTALYLGCNSIGDEGADRLAAALERNSGIVNLSLVTNGIGDHGAEQFASTLERNSTLTSLNLANNNIGAHGAERLVAALRRNTTITALYLEGNLAISRELLDRAKEAAERNRPTQLLTVRCSVPQAREAAFGASELSVSCTGLGGEELGTLALPQDATLVSLRRALAEEVGTAEARLRLLRPDGALLRDARGDAPLCELFGGGSPRSSSTAQGGVGDGGGAVDPAALAGAGTASGNVVAGKWPARCLRRLLRPLGGAPKNQPAQRYAPPSRNGAAGADG